MITKAIKYGATWCNPCRLTEENLKKIGLPFESIDVDENEELAESKNITAIPVVEFLNENDEVVERRTGLLTLDSIREILDSNGNYLKMRHA